MRIFITGGTGFIGIHLCKKLLELNHNITIYDNFSNSLQENFTSKIKQKVTLISGDILDNSKLVTSMKNHDVVIHLAAQISVSESIKNPKLTFDVNVDGTQNVLNACLQNDITKIIATSTAAVYQNTSTKTILNETSPVEPLSPYGISKLQMEKKIIDFASIHKIPAIILRLFNVYGIGQSLEYAGVITKFKENIQNNSPLIIFGDGSAIRDFVHVNDVVDSIILSISHSKNFICNIANGTSTSIFDLAKIMISLSHKDTKILYNPSRSGEIMFSIADISKAKETLKFNPKISLKSGLEQFMSNNEFNIL
jgi:UDP-glucose 4-epimerase